MNNYRYQNGVTLIELMISVTLGIIFLTAAMSFLLSGQQSYQSQDSGTRIQENARFAMEFIREQVRMAGYTENTSVTPDFIHRGTCNAGGDSFTNCAEEIATTSTVLAGDRLAISMVPPDGQDCLGSAVGSTTERIANVIWVEEVGGISSLYCQGYNIDTPGEIGTAQPIVDGIDQLQVMYGVVGTASGFVDRYYTATEVDALTDGWSRVNSVKVGIIVNSGVDTDEAQNDVGTLGNQLVEDQYESFTLFNGTFDTDDATDPRRLRRVFTTLIAMNNVNP